MGMGTFDKALNVAQLGLIVVIGYFIYKGISKLPDVTDPNFQAGVKEGVQQGAADSLSGIDKIGTSIGTDIYNSFPSGFDWAYNTFVPEEKLSPMSAGGAVGGSALP
jgi:hypothetical protein